MLLFLIFLCETVTNQTHKKPQSIKLTAKLINIGVPHLNRDAIIKWNQLIPTTKHKWGLVQIQLLP